MCGELEHWLAGILIWHRGCRRYREEDLHLFHGAPWHLGWQVWLGTSSAQVARLMVRETVCTASSESGGS
ncbi:germacradienol/geosmin synthase [Streptomyces californicus]